MKGDCVMVPKSQLVATRILFNGGYLNIAILAPTDLFIYVHIQ